MLRLMALPARVGAFLAVACCTAFAQANPSASASPPILELRLASDKPAPGFTEQRNFANRDQPGVLYLGENIVSDADLVGARARRAPDGLVVEIQLSDAAAARMRETSANSIGQYMAVLAHGQFAGASTIMAPVPRGNSLNVAMTLPANVADSVRSRVIARWPRPAR